MRFCTLIQNHQPERVCCLANSCVVSRSFFSSRLWRCGGVRSSSRAIGWVTIHCVTNCFKLDKLNRQLPGIDSKQPLLSCILAVSIYSQGPPCANTSWNCTIFRFTGSILRLLLVSHRRSLVAPSLCSLVLPVLVHILLRCLLSWYKLDTRSIVKGIYRLPLLLLSIIPSGSTDSDFLFA